MGLQELQDSFRFTQYLLIASAYQDPQTSAAEPEQKPAKPSKKKPKVRTCFSEMPPHQNEPAMHAESSWHAACCPLPKCNMHQL